MSELTDATHRRGLIKNLRSIAQDLPRLAADNCEMAAVELERIQDAFEGKNGSQVFCFMAPLSVVCMNVLHPVGRPDIPGLIADHAYGGTVTVIFQGCEPTAAQQELITDTVRKAFDIGTIF